MIKYAFKVIIEISEEEVNSEGITTQKMQEYLTNAITEELYPDNLDVSILGEN